MKTDETGPSNAEAEVQCGMTRLAEFHQRGRDLMNHREISQKMQST